MRDNDELPAKAFPYPGDQLPTIAIIGPNLGQTRDLCRYLFEHHLGSGAVSDMGWRNNHLEDLSLRIDQQMTFADMHFFAAIIATPVCAARRSSPIDYPRRRH